MVTFAPTVAICFHEPVEVGARSILKLDSLVELSCQMSWIWFEERAIADRLEGAAGAVPVALLAAKRLVRSFASPGKAVTKNFRRAYAMDDCSGTVCAFRYPVSAAGQVIKREKQDSKFTRAPLRPKNMPPRGSLLAHWSLGHNMALQMVVCFSGHSLSQATLEISHSQLT